MITRKRSLRGLGLGLLGLGTFTLLIWLTGLFSPDRGQAEAVDRLIRERKYEDALQQANRWATHAPKSGEAQFQKARCLLTCDQPEEALRLMELAESLGVSKLRVEGLMGVIYARSGRAGEAERLLRKAQAGSPESDPLVDETLARIDLGALRFGPALKSIDRWSKGSPKDPWPEMLRAEIDRQFGVHPEIIEDEYRAALDRDPKFGPARFGLAELLRKRGRLEDAIKEYETYLFENPEDAGAMSGLGTCSLDSGQEDVAREWFDKALTLNPNEVDALDGRVAIALRSGEAELALPLLDRLVKLEPLNVIHHYKRSLALDRLGRMDEATTERETCNRLRQEKDELDRLRKVAGKNYRDPAPQADLVSWLLSHDRAKEGLKLAQELIQRPGGHPRTAKLLADYYEQQGNKGLANFYRAKAQESSNQGR